jgi:hypothetical protein
VAYSATVWRTGGLLISLFGASIIQAGVGAYWYRLAISMIFAFVGLAWVRSDYPALGKPAFDWNHCWLVSESAR